MRDIISPEDLTKIPLVMYPEGSYGRDLMETGSATSLFQWVKEGAGATIQPSQLIECLTSPGIRGKVTQKK